MRVRRVRNCGEYREISEGNIRNTHELSTSNNYLNSDYQSSGFRQIKADGTKEIYMIHKIVIIPLFKVDF